MFENTRFLETSTTGNWANRLDWRAEVLLKRNRSVVEGRRILDIASHDGRFSWAALELGAAHVSGVEGRRELVEAAKANLAAQGYGEDRCTFSCADIFDALDVFTPGQFDTVFCFGFFYHTIRHIEMIRQFNRLAPQSVIIDTNLHLDRAPDDPPLVALRAEDSTEQHATIDTVNIAGWPNRKYIKLLLDAHGYAAEEIDWRDLDIIDWAGMEDYRDGWRSTFVATRKTIL